MARRQFGRRTTAHSQRLSRNSPRQLSRELDIILTKLDRPTRLADMPGRVELCLQALSIVDRTEAPELWATLQSDLGASLVQNPQGDRAAHLEQAINAYQQSLEVMTREAMPAVWAEIMLHLGNAYANRIRGDRAENLEQAMHCYQQALAVRTRDATPANWAHTMMNLANAYFSRIRGERAANLEQAIAAYQQALEIITRQTMPEDWAQIKMNLALAYASRIQGERAENLEQAIYLYHQALEIITRETMPVDWAHTTVNLALAYAKRIRGERVENLAHAIDLYHQALDVRTRVTWPVEWAEVMNDLGTAYAERTPYLAEEQQAETLKQAIDCYQQALEVRTRQALPLDWAQTITDLANTYYSFSRTPTLAQEERAASLEQAIDCYQQALEVRTRPALPLDWGHTMMNLATATAVRTQFLAGEKRAANIEQAVCFFQQALEVHPLAQSPLNHGRIQRNLGNLLFDEQRWAEADAAFQAAIEAGRLLLMAAYTDIGRRAEVAETAQSFARSAYCRLKLNHPTKALLTLELGKTRLLTETLALSGANLTGLTTAQQQTYQTAVDRVHALEVKLRLPTAALGKRNDRDIAADLAQARTHLNSIIEDFLRKQPDFLPAGLNLDQLLALIPPGGALVAPAITSQGSAVFVLPSGAAMSENGGGGRYVIWLDEFTQADLTALLVGTEDQPGWLRAYRENRATPKRWREAIDELLAQLHQIFITPIVDKLARLGIAPGAPLLLMPQGGLGLLPLHALLLEQYSVTVAPSGYALHAARQRVRAGEQPAASLLAIVNPTGDLPFTPAEGNTVAALFDPMLVTRLDGSSATINVVSQHLQPATCHLLHFSGHGFYNWQEAMQSGLVLADGPLTLARLISQADLSAVRLVTLSACETGLTDIRQSPDEFLGLPAGLMQAGAPSVVSTLWAVNDLSTMLLMERFYRHYLRDELPLPEALRRAQLWLRAVTAGELANRFAQERQTMLSGGAGLLPAEVISEGYNRFKVDYEPNDCPFTHPYYWAAFTFSGV